MNGDPRSRRAAILKAKNVLGMRTQPLGGVRFHRCMLRVNPHHYARTFRGRATKEDAFSHARETVDRAVEQGIEALAIKDRNNVDGIGPFRAAARNRAAYIFPEQRFGKAVRNARTTAAISETGFSTASALGTSLMSRLITETHVTDIVDSKRRSELMSRIRGRDTAPELAVRRIAHRMGLRFRLHRNDLPGRPDLVFPKHRLAVFVHGCFWHRHEGCRHASTPKSRIAFWTEKFAANVVRDARQEAALRALGWRVLVVWQCESRDEAVVERRLAASIGLGWVTDGQEGAPSVMAGETRVSAPEYQSPLRLLPAPHRSDAGLCAASALTPDGGERT